MMMMLPVRLPEIGREIASSVRVLFFRPDSATMLLQRPTRSDALTVAAYWLLATPFIIWAYAYQFGWVRAVAGMTYTIVLDTAAVYVLVYGLLPNALAARHWPRALALLPCFLAASLLLYNYGYRLLLGTPPAANLSAFVVGGILRHAMSYGLLAIFLTLKRYFEMQRRLVLVQKAQAESELRNLRAQLDPHFLFNNLNVLRGLIQQNPAEANEYLNRFAGLYRLLIRHQNEDFVSVSEELRFAQEYVYLLRHRFGTAYDFRLDLEPAPEWDQRLVVPGTLQLLLENAIKHNAGNEDRPLCIVVEATATTLTVHHPRQPKLSPVDSTGTGLTNLRERYRLLFDQEIRVVSTAETFAVTVPVLSETPAWMASGPGRPGHPSARPAPVFGTPDLVFGGTALMFEGPAVVF